MNKFCWSCRETTRECILEHGDSQPALLPRNKKQAYNIQHQLAQEQDHDDLYDVYLFGKQYPQIVLKVDLIPQVIIVQMHPDMNLHIASLQRASDNVVLHYDTTFDIGKFYTSILSMRHPLFKNEPLIPVAVMYHENTSERCHEIFFRTITERIDLNKPSTIIVTDREKGIINTISKTLTCAKHLFCWNHLRRVSCT